MLTFLVILAFIAMVLAPCVVALWGRVREDADQDQAQSHADTVVEESQPAGAFSRWLAPEGPLARSVRKLTSALQVQRTAAGDGTAIPQNFAAQEPFDQELVGQEPAPYPDSTTLEALLHEAVEGARIARAASLRADAVASEAAARLAAMRAQTAAEQSRRAQHSARAAEQAALSANQAYEAIRAEARKLEPLTEAELNDSQQEIALLSDRRAA